LKDELRSALQSVAVMHCKVGCKSSYKVQREKKKPEGRRGDDEKQIWFTVLSVDELSEEWTLCI
jgi:hypothetical protein